jgi:transcriptional regulator with XRE-family HTH domain
VERAVKSFGETLLGYIAASDFRSQRQFALAIEMEPTYLNRIIKGNVQRPDPETLRKMADKLDRSYAELLEAAGYPPIGGSDNGETRRPLAPVEPDAALDPERIVKFVESHPDASFRAELAEIRAEIADEDYVAMCVDTFRAWLSNGQLAVRTARRIVGRGDVPR